MSGASKKRRFLSPNQISELVWDSESEDKATSSDSMSEDEGGFQDKPGVSHLQPDCPTSSGQASSSSISTSASDGFQSGSGQEWTRPSGPQRGVVHTFTGGPRGKRNSEAPHLNNSSSPLSVFLLYFAEIIRLLVVETNRYYHDHLERLDEGPLPLPDVTEAKMLASCNNNTNGTLHTGQTDKLLVKGLQLPLNFLRQHYETGQILSHLLLSTLHRQQE